MLIQPINTTWKITCHSPEEARALRNWLAVRIGNDRVMTDTVRTKPNGVEQLQTVPHRLGDYFEDIRTTAESPDTDDSFQLIFQRLPTPGRFWKDLMVNILQEIKTAPQMSSLEVVSTANLLPI